MAPDSGLTMWATPTTTVTVLRDSGIDEFDGSATTLTIATGVRASLIEQQRTRSLPVSGEPSLPRNARARLPRTQDVKRTDRILDEATGRTWAIESVRLVTAPFHLNDLTLELVRIDPVDP